MLATKRSIEMYNRRLYNEYFILAKLGQTWGRLFPIGNYQATKVGGGGSRERKETRLNKKLKKFGFKE